MNLAALWKAFQTVMAVRDIARNKQSDFPPEGDISQAARPGLAGQLELKLTNVVVSALKEAFDRDHARLEMERAHLEEQRRQAEERVRMELRRQSADRESGRLRFIAGIAMAGWVASVMLLVLRLGDASVLSRVVLVAGWLLLLCSLAASFTALRRIGANLDSDRVFDTGKAGASALWLLIAGLALSAACLLF